MTKTADIELDENFREFIALLNSKKVKYLLVGGFAVGLHGYPRYTGDLDIWVESGLENGEKIVNALNEFGFGSLNRKPTDFVEPDLIHQFGYPPLRIDILTGVSGLEFEGCYKRKKQMILGGEKVAVLHLNDLKRNKVESGRPEDLFDVKKLEKVERSAKKKIKK